MADRITEVIVSLLVLVAVCALLLGAVVWLPAKFGALDRQLSQLEALRVQVQVMHDQLEELDKVDSQLKKMALAATPLARIDTTVDNMSTRVNSVLTTVSDLKDRVAAKSDLDRITTPVGQLDQKVAALAAPMGRVDTAVAGIGTKVDSIAATVSDLKDHAAAKGDLERIAAQVNQLDQKVAALASAAPKTDPAVTTLATDVADLKALIEAMRKLVDESSREISKDVKQLNLEMQKLQPKPAAEGK